MRPPITVAAAVTLFALSGCTSDSQPTHPQGSSAGPSTRTGGAAPRHAVPLDCGDYIGAYRLVNGLQVVLGVVALPTSAAGPALGTALTGEAPAVPRLFAKTGLLIKTGTDFKSS